MSADRLREAAREIRETAEPLPDGWFEPCDPDVRAAFAAHYDPQAIGSTFALASHIGLWSPVVALLVADWLDSQAADFDFLGTQSEHDIAALRVANAILGGTP